MVLHILKIRSYKILKLSWCQHRKDRLTSIEWPICNFFLASSQTVWCGCVSNNYVNSAGRLRIFEWADVISVPWPMKKSKTNQRDMWTRYFYRGAAANVSTSSSSLWSPHWRPQETPRSRKIATNGQSKSPGLIASIYLPTNVPTIELCEARHASMSAIIARGILHPPHPKPSFKIWIRLNSQISILSRGNWYTSFGWVYCAKEILTTWKYCFRDAQPST